MKHTRLAKIAISAALALMLVFALGTTAFAAQSYQGTGTFDPSVGPQGGKAVISDAEGVDVQAALTKELLTGHTTDLPLSADFFFTFTGKSTPALSQAIGNNNTQIPLPNNYTAGSNTPGQASYIAPVAIQINDGTATALTANTNVTDNHPVATPAVTVDRVKAYNRAALTGTDGGTVNGQDTRIQRYQLSSGNFLAGVTFNAEGTYLYEVEEVGYFYQKDASGKYTEAMAKSTAKYDMYVYVKEYEDTNTTPATKKFYIYALGTVVTTEDSTPGSQYWRPIRGDKVNTGEWVTVPGTNDGTVQAYNSQMSFFNEWERKHTDQNEYYVLEVEKQVKGNLDSADQRWQFTVNVSKPMSSDDQYVYAKVLDSTGANVTTSRSAISTTTYKGEVVMRVEWATDGTASIIANLGNGDKICFIEMPVGTFFNTVEQQQTGWTATTKVIIGGTELDGAQTTDPFGTTGTSGTTKKLDEGQNRVETTNAKPDGPPTGIILNNLPFFILIAVAAAAIIAYAVIKGARRKVAGR